MNDRTKKGFEPNGHRVDEELEVGGGGGSEYRWNGRGECRAWSIGETCDGVYAY